MTKKQNVAFFIRISNKAPHKKDLQVEPVIFVWVLDLICVEYKNTTI
jgi:hypothetical protein